MFDGDGFVRGVAAQGPASFEARSALVVGSGGVGSAIAASLAAAGVAGIGLVRRDATRRPKRWASGCAQHYPRAGRQRPGRTIPAGYDIVVNATPLGMNEGDPLPMDMSRLAPATFVGEVVMKQEMTPFLRGGAGTRLPDPGRHRHAVRADPGVPGVLRLPTTTPEELRSVAQLQY